MAPPIQLFNPAFAYFSSKAFDSNYIVPPEFIRNVVGFMARCALIYPSEASRQGDLKSRLAGVLCRPLISTINHNGTQDGTRPDFQVLGSVGSHSLHLVVGEEKNEFGDGGSDPLTRVGLSYWQIFRQEYVKPFHSAAIFFVVADA